MNFSKAMGKRLLPKSIWGHKDRFKMAGAAIAHVLFVARWPCFFMYKPGQRYMRRTLVLSVLCRSYRM